MKWRWRDLLAVIGLRARVRSLTPAELRADPELGAVHGKRIELEATADLLRLEASLLGVEADDDTRGRAR